MFRSAFKIFLLLLVVSGIGEFTFAGKACSKVIKGDRFYSLTEQSPSAEQAEATQKLIGYLSTLIENGFLKASHIERLHASLLQGDFANPLTQTESKLATGIEVHWLGFQAYMDQELDIKSLEIWVGETLGKLKTNTESRSFIEEETSDISRKIEFVGIKKGGVWVAASEESHKEAFRRQLAGDSTSDIEADLNGDADYYELLQDFEISSTSITQAQWFEVMGALPEEVLSDAESVLISADGQLYGGDYPIVGITVWSMMVFANKLSEHHGLVPVYDLSEMKMIGDPARGDYVPESDAFGRKVKGGLKIKINSPGGDYYAALGFRLPTFYEHEYVGRYLSQEYTKYHFGDDPAELDEHAAIAPELGFDGEWPVEVATRKPLVTPEGNIYDYHGNNSEMLFDWYAPVEKQNPYPDPAGYEMRHKEFSMIYYGPGGGFFASDPDNNGFGQSSSLRRLDESSYALGFRLVRSLPEGSLK